MEVRREGEKTSRKRVRVRLEVKVVSALTKPGDGCGWGPQPLDDIEGLYTHHCKA